MEEMKEVVVPSALGMVEEMTEEEQGNGEGVVPKAVSVANSAGGTSIPYRKPTHL